MMQFLCTCTVRFCTKMPLESVGHVTCISCFLRQKLSNFFIFNTLGEEILVRARTSATLANAEHLPKQSSVYSSLQHTSSWPRLPKHGYMVPLRGGTTRVVQYGAIDHVPPYNLFILPNCTTRVIPPLGPPSRSSCPAPFLCPLRKGSGHQLANSTAKKPANSNHQPANSTAKKTTAKPRLLYSISRVPV